MITAPPVTAPPTPWPKSPTAPGPDRPAVRAGSHHADPDPDQLTTGLGVRWPSGLLASRTDVHTTACSAKVTYVVGSPPTPSTGNRPAVGFAQRYATKANAPPWPYVTGRDVCIPAAPCPRTAASPTTSALGRPRPHRPDQPRADLPFSPPHSPPRETRHHPNPHRPLHRHPHQPGTTHRRPVTRPDRPDPTDPKPHEAPSDGVRTRPTGPCAPVTEACPQPARDAHSTARSGARTSGPEPGLRRTVAAGSTTEPAAADTRKPGTTADPHPTTGDRPSLRRTASSSPQITSQFASMRCPPSVSTDSGWNCTPPQPVPGVAAPRSPPVSVAAVTSNSSGHGVRPTASEWYRVAVIGLAGR